jgi:8-oxo-dGTP pyrophosphatase MutT (NUDIX family)
MANLQQYQAKICYTACGCLIYKDKVLLVKHKKLGLWLNPGGHIEKDELAHSAAEREFWEETGIKVKAVAYGELESDSKTEFLPNPISTNLHWVSQENFNQRTQGDAVSEKTKQNWSKGCEQHISFMYLVEPVNGVEFAQNVEETDGIAWFSEAELEKKGVMGNVLTEIHNAFAITKTLK